ncbi:MAG: TetR/AcrR family transcriptional regulator [Dactylosporangium sp.]|nr:TetR family transcriptional regulator [Dactylosporangium sp.]NNJ59702.1 TetR/AcrR family transcriptional regulator [Dactylosporangium sp.]
MARTGRRPGNQDTKQAILAAAREAFGERGYDGASIRAIATSAGVDPALVHHYFGAKDQLFLAAVEFPLDPNKIIPTIIAGNRDHLGERLVRTILQVWDSPTGITAAALVRSAVQHEWMARLLREFLLTQIFRRVSISLDMDPQEATVRGPLVLSQVIGLIATRYILRIEPLASAPPDLVVALIGPTMQRYLTGPLSPGAAAGHSDHVTAGKGQPPSVPPRQHGQQPQHHRDHPD